MSEWIDLEEAAKKINDASEGTWNTTADELRNFCKNHSLPLVKQKKKWLIREQDLANELHRNTMPRP